MILHHPSDATLIAQVAGTLPPLHARVLGVHLAACPLCRNALHDLEEVGGALLAALPPAPLRPDALARTLARLDDAVTAPEEPPAPTDLAGLATGRWWWLGVTPPAHDLTLSVSHPAWRCPGTDIPAGS